MLKLGCIVPLVQCWPPRSRYDPNSASTKNRADNDRVHRSTGADEIFSGTSGSRKSGEISELTLSLGVSEETARLLVLALLYQRISTRSYIVSAVLYLVASNGSRIEPLVTRGFCWFTQLSQFRSLSHVLLCLPLLSRQADKSTIGKRAPIAQSPPFRRTHGLAFDDPGCSQPTPSNDSLPTRFMALNARGSRIIAKARLFPPPTNQ